MELLPLYKSILKAGHLVVDDEGFIKRVWKGKKEPWLIDGKSVVLPTDEQLKAPTAETIVFHPLFEFLTRAESTVTAEYRRVVTERLHLSFLALASELLKIGASQQMHAKLSPEQSEFLSFVPEADKEMFETFEKLCDAMPEGQNQKAFVSMYLKRGGIVQGKSAHRAAIVTFPLYKQLVEDGQKRDAVMSARKHAPKKKDEKKEEEKLPVIPNETYGVKMRKIDREAFIKLFEYMVPGIAEVDSYSATSNSNIAPSMDAIMHAVQNLAAPLNDMVERFKDKLSESAQIILRVEDAWVPEFVNLAPLQVQIRMIPMQDGNDGALPVPTDKQSVEAEARATAPKAVPQASVPTPQVAASAAAAPKAEEEHAPAGFRLPPKNPQQPPAPTYGGVPAAAPAPAPAPAYPPYQAPAYPPAYAAAPQAPVVPPPGMPGVHPALAAFAAPYMAAMAAPYAAQQDLPTWAYGGGTQRPVEQPGYPGAAPGYPYGIPRGDF